MREAVIPKRQRGRWKVSTIAVSFELPAGKMEFDFTNLRAYGVTRYHRQTVCAS